MKRTILTRAGMVCGWVALVAGGCGALDTDTTARNSGWMPKSGTPTAARPSGTAKVATRPDGPIEQPMTASANNTQNQNPAFQTVTSRMWSPNTARVSFSEEGADFDPCVSRDGDKIVFASTQHRTTADLYVKRVNSRTVTQLSSGGSDNVMPDISPDGERIAFATNRAGSWDIYVMASTGGQAVQITSDVADELHPTWSPDGKSLVYCKLGEMSGRWEMWVADVQNPSSPTFIGYGLFPQWCPVASTGENGADKILFQLSRERGQRTFGLWTMDFGNGIATNSTEVASEPTKALINPTWSPDGQWICYAEMPVNGTDTTATTGVQGATTSRLPSVATLWMIGADGTGKVNLVAGGGASLMPAWGSDGTIYFVSNRGGFENIWSFNSIGAIKAARGSTPVATERPVAGTAEPVESEER